MAMFDSCLLSGYWWTNGRNVFFFFFRPGDEFEGIGDTESWTYCGHRRGKAAVLFGQETCGEVLSSAPQKKMCDVSFKEPDKRILHDLSPLKCVLFSPLQHVGFQKYFSHSFTWWWWWWHWCLTSLWDRTLLTKTHHFPTNFHFLHTKLYWTLMTRQVVGWPGFKTIVSVFQWHPVWGMVVKPFWEIDRNWYTVPIMSEIQWWDGWPYPNTHLSHDIPLSIAINMQPSYYMPIYANIIDKPMECFF